MSHTKKFQSFTLHHDGDYFGHYSIVSTRKDKDYAIICEDDYPSINISAERFDDIARKILKEKKYSKNYNLDLIVKEKNTKFKVWSKEVAEFYLEKLRNLEIFRLENMGFEQLEKNFRKNI